MRDWRMRTKLAAVLVIPSLAFLALAGVQTGSLIAQATELNEFAAEVGVADEIGLLVHSLQQERDRTAGELAAPRPDGGVDAAGLAAAVSGFQIDVDDAAQRFRAAAAPLARGDVSWQVTYTRSVELIDQLPALRTAATGTAAPQTIFDSYSRMIDSLLGLLAEPSPGASRPELSQAVLRSVQIARVKEIGSRIRAYLYAAARRGIYTPDDLVVLADLRSQRIAALSDFRIDALPAQAAYYDDVSVTPPFVAGTRMEEATPSGTGRVLLDPDPWWTASQDRFGQLLIIEDRIFDDAADVAGDRSGEQLRRTLLVADPDPARAERRHLDVGGRRPVDRPVAARAAHARAPGRAGPAARGAGTTTRRRPERAGDRGVATGGALDGRDRRGRRGVRRGAPQRGQRRRRAGADAALRSTRCSSTSPAAARCWSSASWSCSTTWSARRATRTSSTTCSSSTTSPPACAATTTACWCSPAARPRGAGATRSRSPAVVLAAVAEIEHYPRVRHEAIDPVYVVGHAVADLVHLLAELLENATVFSPPHTPVQVTARGGEQGAIIEISDEGLGMSPAAIQDANDLLAAPPAADVAASERMGLFVVSHLAARHRVRVELRGVTRGVIAVVRLPAELIAATQSQLPYQPARPVLASVSAFAAGPSSARVGRDGPDYARAGAEYGSPYPQTGPAYTPTAPSPYGNGNGTGTVTGVPVSGVPVSGMPVSGVPMQPQTAQPGHLSVAPGLGIPVAGRQPGAAPAGRPSGAGANAGRRQQPAQAGERMVVAVGGTGRG